jgi:hypothetical protein
METSTDNWRQQELYKAMMVLPVEGLKIICWINGGAAISILTYVGNLVSKNNSAPSLDQLRPAIIWYCAGLASAAVTFLVSYLVQLTFWYALERKEIDPLTRLRHRLLILLGCLLSLFGVFAFSMGSINAAYVLAP